ncbi:hypothetical protein ACFLZY_01905 [Patescibacteria group bacterium]
MSESTPRENPETGTSHDSGLTLEQQEKNARKEAEAEYRKKAQIEQEKKIVEARIKQLKVEDELGSAEKINELREHLSRLESGEETLEPADKNLKMTEPETSKQKVFLKKTLQGAKKVGVSALAGGGLAVLKFLRFFVDKTIPALDNLFFRIEKFGYGHSGWFKKIFPEPKPPKNKEEKKGKKDKK